MHRDRRDPAAERHDALGTDPLVDRDATTGRLRHRRNRTPERTRERERDEIDRTNLQAAGFHRRHEPTDGRRVRGDQKHLHRGLVARAGRRSRRTEDREVEDRVLDRDRNEVAGLELQRARKLGPSHQRHLDLADDNARAGDADAHRRSLQADFGA